MTQRATPRPAGKTTPHTPVRDVMRRDPVVVDDDTRAVDAARTMQARDIGDVLVRAEGGALGILTDRDLVIRLVANERDLFATTAGEIASHSVATLTPDDTVARAVELMRERAVRRLPVVEDGVPVGIVSLGDLAVERASGSVLADISAASPNL